MKVDNKLPRRRIGPMRWTVLGTVLGVACGSSVNPGGSPSDAGSNVIQNEDASGGAGSKGAAGDGACRENLTTDPLNCGSCGHSCLGGACVAGTCQAFALVTNADNPWDLAVDDTHAYWILAGTPAGSFHDGAVLRASKTDGGAVTTVASPFDNPWSIAVDANNVYWTVHGLSPGGMGTVSSRAKSLISNSTLLAQGLTEPEGIALDATRVYWAEPGIGVHSVPIGGGAPPTSMATLAGRATVLLVDSQYLYMNASHRTDAGTFRGISRVPKTGGVPTILIDPSQDVRSMAFDGSTIVYAATTLSGTAGALYRVAIDGGVPTMLAADVNARGLVVDDTSIYWADGLGVGLGTPTGTVWKMSKAGGTMPQALASQQPGPWALHGDASAIYWLNYGLSTGTPYLFAGAVMKLAK